MQAIIPPPPGANRLSFNVAGVRHENRQATIAQHLLPGTELLICRQNGNPHDALACIIVTAQGGQSIGFVPRAWNNHFQQGVYRANVVQLIPMNIADQIGPVGQYINVLIFVQNNGQPILPAGILDIVNGHGLGMQIEGD